MGITALSLETIVRTTEVTIRIPTMEVIAHIMEAMVITKAMALIMGVTALTRTMEVTVRTPITEVTLTMARHITALLRAWSDCTYLMSPGGIIGVAAVEEGAAAAVLDQIVRGVKSDIQP